MYRSMLGDNPFEPAGGWSVEPKSDNNYRLLLDVARAAVTFGKHVEEMAAHCKSDNDRRNPIVVCLSREKYEPFLAALSRLREAGIELEEEKT